MKLTQTRRRGRRGFTLVELLIVIAIISLLISLISAAVWKALVTANRTRNRSEIAQMTAAMETFKARFGFYPPSRIKLAEILSPSTYPNANAQGSLDYDSIQTLNRMFNKMGANWSTNGINWFGRSWNGPSPAVTVLEGDQCLVFFLGGIPNNNPDNAPPNCTGFSTNPLDPSYHIKNGGDTLPPFFEFDTSRLVRADGQGNTRSKAFYSYLDNYRLRPYAYFSSGNSRGDYNRHYKEFKNSDCRSLLVDPNNPTAGTVWPYAEAVANMSNQIPTRPTYIKPDSFQIISAGADGLFGTGTVINGVLQQKDVWLGGRTFPASAGYANGEPGFDDQCNFRESTLGSGS
jgi:prepilin-type N-terminal cleavage/methylation domain-containing protein